eukprot:scaffold5533_cov104-Skeletonema_marinoi.AAC.1
MLRLARINQQRSRHNHLRKATHSKKDVSAMVSKNICTREEQRRSRLPVATPTTGGKGRRERCERVRPLALLASLFSHAVQSPVVG